MERTLNSASVVFALKYVKSTVVLPLNKLWSKPSSSSVVRSGPRSGLPTLFGQTAVAVPQPTWLYVRTAAKAPGARPAGRSPAP